MAYKEVTDMQTDSIINLGGKDKKTGKPNPVSIEGYYLGATVLEGGKYGPSTKHVFSTAKGNVGVWGRGNLNGKLGSVTQGTMTLVNFEGMKDIPGKNPMYNYKVKHDPSNTIEVDAASTPADTEDAYSDSAYDQETAEDEDTLLDEDVPLAKVVAASATAANKAKVQALLGKRK